MILRLPQGVSATRPPLAPGIWDVAAFVLVCAGFVLTAHGSREAMAPLATVEAAHLSLEPAHLPEYALRTTLRMLAALAASLAFTLVYGALCAKSRRAEMLLVPLLDFLQSVPILGFLSFTVVGFMALLPGRAMGVELAAVFAIFTSQAWNMAFSFYQSLRTLPADLVEACRAFRLSPWQRFWRLEVPFAVPGLVWNAMMSMSGGWFFIVAAEAISVGDERLILPGVGSYVAAAIAARDLGAIGWAVLTMLLVIAAYDQLLFRPLVAWADTFRFEIAPGQDAPRSWMLDLLRRAQVFRLALSPLTGALSRIGRLRLGLPRHAAPARPAAAHGDRIWLGSVVVAVAAALWLDVRFVASELDWAEVAWAFALGAATLARVAVLVVLASLVWVPVGVWIGLRPRVAERAQLAAQFLAAFPANLLFPLAVMAIVRFDLSPDVWLSPLMILGTQWYILFNVVAGASAFPAEMRDAVANFRIRGWLWWRKVILPGIFPYYVTGGITASGGSWNASIVAELADWGDTTVVAHGIGAYIAEATQAGDYPRIVLGITVLSAYVMLLNRLFWRPLYALAARRTGGD